MKRYFIALFVFTSLYVFQPVSAATSADVLKISGVSQTSTTSTTPMKIEPGGETIYVLRDPLLTVDDLVQASSMQAGSEVQLSVRLTNDGSRRLADYTRLHQGDRLAVIVNGRVRLAPVIRDSIRNPLVVGPMSRADALEIEHAVNH